MSLSPNKIKENSLAVLKDGNGVPSGFVLKLYQMVNGAPDDVISWIPSGDAFRISNLHRLENETLPAFFRHKRFQSLVRQLNFYNFRKVNRERTFWVYRHVLFHRDRPGELHLLRRRTCPGFDGRKHRHVIRKNGLPSVKKKEKSNVDSLSDESNGSRTMTICKRRMSNESVQNDTYLRKKFRGLPCSMNNNGYASPIINTEPYESSMNSSTMNTTTYEYTQYISNIHPVRSYDKTRNTLSQENLDNPTTVPESNSIFYTRSLDKPTPIRQCASLEPKNINKINKITNSFGTEEQNTSEEVTFNTEESLKSEQLEQSLLVNKVARQLDAHVRRVTANHTLEHRKSGRRKFGMFPLQRLYMDTMKYHALTYDDEVETIVTTPIDKQLREGEDNPNEVYKFGYRLNREGYMMEESDIGSNLKENPNSMNRNLSNIITPPVDDINMISGIVKKLNKWVGWGDQYVWNGTGEMTAAIVGFGMSTSPQDPSFYEKAKQLLLACSVLEKEFQKYCEALAPHMTFVSMEIIPSVDNSYHPYFFEDTNRNKSSCQEVIRKFQVFVLNTLRYLVKNVSLVDCVKLSGLEETCVQKCMNIWFEGCSMFL